MKIFKLLAVAFVAMLSFSSCDQHECEDFDYDHSADLVGTWTCLQENFAEALVIKADGSVTSTGVAFGEYWENVEGKIEIKNGKATMTFEDHDNYEGHFDIIPGVAFSIYNDKERSVSTVRISLSYVTTNEEINKFLNIFRAKYKQLSSLMKEN